MKIMTILGTRPEIIRLSLVISLLDHFCQHTPVHTGQNNDDGLSQVFFDELEVRKPDVHKGVRTVSLGGQIGQILEHSEALFLEHRPDWLLILADANSGLVAIIARRLGISVYYMEAGNRCYDDRIPEDVLCGIATSSTVATVRLAIGLRGTWKPPLECLAPDVAETVGKIVLGYRAPDLPESAWRQHTHS